MITVSSAIVLDKCGKNISSPCNVKYLVYLRFVFVLRGIDIQVFGTSKRSGSHADAHLVFSAIGASTLVVLDCCWT